MKPTWVESLYEDEVKFKKKPQINILQFRVDLLKQNQDLLYELREHNETRGLESN